MFNWFVFLIFLIFLLHFSRDSANQPTNSPPAMLVSFVHSFLIYTNVWIICSHHEKQPVWLFFLISLVIYRATWRTFQSKLPPQKKKNPIPPPTPPHHPLKKNSLYSRKWNFLTLRLKISYNFGNGTRHFSAPASKLFPKKLS